MDILDDLLKDIQNSKPTNKAKAKTSQLSKMSSSSDNDFLDFDDLFEPVKKPQKERLDSSISSNTNGKASPSSVAETSAERIIDQRKPPRIEDFASFDDYINALVSYEKATPNDNAGSTSKSDTSTTKKNSQQTTPKRDNEDYFDDEFMALFGDTDMDELSKKGK